MIAKMFEEPGWVLLRNDNTVMGWSFARTRTESIKELTRGSKQNWRKWRREGVRCVKAKRTVTAFV